MSYQKLILQGNVGKINEPRYTATGDLVLGFSVAYSEGKDKPTTWFNCTAFKKTAELVQQYLKVGDQVIVEGRIKCEKFTDKNTGQEREAWKVDVSQIGLLNNKRDDAQQAPEPKPEPAKQDYGKGGFDNFDDDVKF